jgi:outer membrane protein assembly factor BamE (lipoprotein component of BamABCDE complex)
MMRNLKIKFFLSLLIAVVFGLGLSSNANAQAQKVKAAFNHEAATQQPLYTEYRGVRLGMSAEEARAKLGTPALKASDQDYYVFTENESAQIGYDTAHKVVTISVDYLGGIGAPDYKAVVGGELQREANGTLYRMVRYESLGFWVSYNRTTGLVTSVSVTIQKI